MAGSINLANVALGFDATKLVKGVLDSAGELRKLNQIFRESISPVDRYNADMLILEKAHRAGALSADRLVQAEEALAKKYNMINTELTTTIRLTQKEIDLQDRLAMSSKKAADSMGGGGGAGVGGVMLGLRGMIPGASLIGGAMAMKGAVTSASEQQASTLAFEVMLKSREKALMVAQQMRDLDAKSPMSFGAIQQAGRGLIQYRVAAEEVVPLLARLGDITMGDAEKFKLMAYALGQVKGAGRLMGQEARQMTDAGFNPLAQIADEMAKKFGGLADDYMPKLKKQMEDAKIPFREVVRAIEAATSAGGTFAGMTDRISAETTKGAFAKMKSDVEKLGVSIGNAVDPLSRLFATTVSLSAQVAAIPSNGWNRFVNTNTTVRESMAALEKSFKQMESSASVVAQKQEQITASAKQQADYRIKAFEDERKGFTSMTKSIDDEYQKKMLGERKYKEMQLLTALSGNEMTERDKLARAEAIRKQEAIWFMEDKEKKEKEDEKRVEKEVKLREQYEDKRNKIYQDLKEKQEKSRQNDPDALKISQTIAPALKAGSVEAYKFMMNQKDKLAELAEDQKKILFENQRIAEKQLAQLERIPAIGRVR